MLWDIRGVRVTANCYVFVLPQLVKLQIENRSHVCYVLGGCRQAPRLLEKAKVVYLRSDR